MEKQAMRCLFAVLVLVGVLTFGDAGAVDGNYVSPYQTQWDSSSSAASLPLETLFGGFLLSLNVLAVLVFTIRNRRRQKP
jgi:hypothetical protein